MTEGEYIQHLLTRAERYIEAVRRDHPTLEDGEAIKAWETTKEKLSAHTLRDLCRAYLDASRKAA